MLSAKRWSLFLSLSVLITKKSYIYQKKSCPINFIVNILPTDDLPPPDARTSAGIVMTETESRICAGTGKCQYHKPFKIWAYNGPINWLSIIMSADTQGSQFSMKPSGTDSR